MNVKELIDDSMLDIIIKILESRFNGANRSAEYSLDRIEFGIIYFRYTATLNDGVVERHKSMLTFDTNEFKFKYASGTGMILNKVKTDRLNETLNARLRTEKFDML